MIGAVVLAGGFPLLATSARGLVPGRLQSSAEMIHEFVSKTLIHSASGKTTRITASHIRDVELFDPIAHATVTRGGLLGIL